MKNLLSILAILIFTLGFSQVKKTVKKKYIPKKKYVQKKKVNPPMNEVPLTVPKELTERERRQLPAPQPIQNPKKDSVLVGDLATRRDTVIAKETIIGTVKDVVKSDAEIAEKILKSSGYISTRNFDTKGNVSAYFKGVYVYQKNNKIYFLLEINNRSLIDYSVDMISFSKKTGSTEGVEALDSADNNLSPIASFPNQSIFKGKTKTKVVLVFKKFSISERTNLILNITEKSGDRDLQIEVKGKWFVGAKSIR